MLTTVIAHRTNYFLHTKQSEIVQNNYLFGYWFYAKIKMSHDLGDNTVELVDEIYYK